MVIMTNHKHTDGSNLSDCQTASSLSSEDHATAPSRSASLPFPRAWYYFGSVRELSRGPVTRTLLGKQLVGFLTSTGKPGVLISHCVHMGSDLGTGCVVGESIQCALHNWRFNAAGQCLEIPATATIPAFARQTSFPAVVRGGCVYFFNGPEALYPLPFFEGFQPEDLVAARPFVEYLECPWYMVGANAVDVQHFAIAHDRRMERTPDVDYPHPHTHRTVCHFEIVGNSFGDRMTRRFGGPNVRLEIVDWGSTMIFARSTLAKTETFGIVSVVPLSEERTMGHVTVMARPGKGTISRALDPLRAFIRRILIRKFLRSDVGRLSGTRYSPNTLIEIDGQFSEYFHWLKRLNGHS